MEPFLLLHVTLCLGIGTLRNLGTGILRTCLSKVKDRGRGGGEKGIMNSKEQKCEESMVLFT